MSKVKLKIEFFRKPTLSVAESLLGQVLVRKVGKKEIRAIVCETEAYVGEKDRACHASRGRTARSEVLYWNAGHSYVYLIYGIHYCFNVVTEKKDFPSAVLIRGVVPLTDFQPKNPEKSEKIFPSTPFNITQDKSLRINGPGRVCKFFKINKKFHGVDLIGNNSIWFERKPKIVEAKIKRAPRIGVEYAGVWAKKPWRFILDFKSAGNIKKAP